MSDLTAPFPWYGGKRRAAGLVWERFGDVSNYLEPFFGGGAVLLGRPEQHHHPRRETVNDADGLIANFWRALAAAPEEVARHADWPVSELDLHARHRWLVEQRRCLVERLEADPDAFDARVAGWWVWGISQWVGGAWCRPTETTPWRQRPHISGGHDGNGIHRPPRRRPNIAGYQDGRGCAQGAPPHGNLESWFSVLSDRLRRVRVLCGDWTRCVSDVALGTGQRVLTGVFLDPPYAHDRRATNIYSVDDATLSDDCRAWCVRYGVHAQLRIALCGVDDEHDELLRHGWGAICWSGRERIWFSPGCLGGMQGVLL